MAIETYEVVVSGILAGQFVQTVLHCNANNTTDIPPFEVANDLLSTFAESGNIVELFCDALPTDYSVTSARSRRVLSTGGPTQIWLAANLSVSTGQRTGTVGSSQVNPVVVWLTTLRPTKTGRTFMPGVSEADIDQMTYSAGVLTAIETFGAAWRDGGATTLNAIDWVGSVYRRTLALADPITNFRVSPVVGTQRRRLHPV